MNSLLVLLFIALFAISNCYSDTVLSIQTFQYSAQLCNYTDSSIDSNCVQSDWTNQFYITFGECVHYQNIASIFTLSPSNTSVTLETYSDNFCGTPEQTQTIPIESCNNNCPSVPSLLTLLERENVMIPAETVVKAWFNGACVQGGWKKAFKLLDIALVYKCVNLADKDSAILSCDPKILTISYDGSSNNCNSFGNTVNYPLGLTCGQQQSNNVEFFCNSS